ncbi:MAG: hypothetical protein AAFY26_23800, partial [Cyanobacteria bacterium J06638_22]
RSPNSWVDRTGSTMSVLPCRPTTRTVMEAMELERAAESKKKAAISEAEGKKRAAIEEAEGAVQSMKLISEALRSSPNSQEILRYLVAQKYVDANYRLGDSPNSKVVFMDPKALTEALGDLLYTEGGNPVGNSGGGGNGQAPPPPPPPLPPSDAKP